MGHINARAGRRRAKWKGRSALIGVVGLVAVLLSACSGGNPGSLSGGLSAQSQSPGEQPFTLGAVSSISNLVWEYAKGQGYYSDQGLDLKIATADSGPALVTGVINGTYDVSTLAALPALVAISKGADLRIFNATSEVAPRHGTSGVLVAAKSSITSYKDLVGKTVATNALTSLNVLVTKMAVKAAGGDPSGIKFVALPFKSSLQAVAQGQVDAAVVITPFITQGEEAGLRNIGDPTADALQEGTSYNVVITSGKTAQNKAAAIKGFNQASDKAVDKLVADPDMIRSLAQTESIGVSKNDAEKMDLPDLSSKPVDVAKLQALADAAQQYGFIASKLDVSKYVITP
ncbi:hypothetical protein GCM10022240_03690 [Microbacterium kribbense]|uniref:SsuA/THI5-like domain-containing protein n=1 Tax=Microbacterium kribbense TaxID=433645 RepID=A0ABP7G8B2_9MICO